MTDQNLSALSPTTSVSVGFPILVTGNAMKMISDPATAASCQRVIERAIKFTQEPPIENPRTVIFESCPLTVHADPTRRTIIILSKFPGWPAVTDDLIEELLPYVVRLKASKTLTSLVAYSPWKREVPASSA